MLLQLTQVLLKRIVYSAAQPLFKEPLFAAQTAIT